MSDENGKIVLKRYPEYGELVAVSFRIRRDVYESIKAMTRKANLSQGDLLMMAWEEFEKRVVIE